MPSLPLPLEVFNGADTLAALLATARAHRDTQGILHVRFNFTAESNVRLDLPGWSPMWEWLPSTWRSSDTQLDIPTDELYSILESHFTAGAVSVPERKPRARKTPATPRKPLTKGKTVRIMSPPEEAQPAIEEASSTKQELSADHEQAQMPKSILKRKDTDHEAETPEPKRTSRFHTPAPETPGPDSPETPVSW